MPRSGKEARRRLQDAALELFQERGYEATTAAEIAARAGVTERTLFRHFLDKREVLFDGEEAFRDALVAGVLDARQGSAPMEALFHAFRSVESVLRGNRSFSEPRQVLIAQTPALQERVLLKTAGLINALTTALRRRGMDETTARLAAQVGMAMFSHAATAWFADPLTGLEAHLERADADLRCLLP